MRTWLFVPGHESRKVQKALTSDADAVIIDWEDAVPAGQKEAARAATAEVLATVHSRPRLVIRVNSPRSGLCESDLTVLADLPAAAVMLPKVDDPADVRAVASLGLPIIPMIESAVGLERAYEIAACHPQVERLAFGSLDFLADIAARWTIEGEALLYARSRIVIAGRAAQRDGPIDGVYPRLHDLDGLRREAQLARSLGFAGKQLIHPEQIAVVEEVFSPTAEEIEQARAILKAYQEALAANRAATTAGTTFIDPPVVRRAEQVLRQAGEEF